MKPIRLKDPILRPMKPCGHKLPIIILGPKIGFIGPISDFGPERRTL